MKRIAFLLAWSMFIVAPLAACNDVGNCPASAAVQPGASCSGDNLQCPYTLDTPSPACDGTAVEGGLQTSCVCQKGAWSCPSPVSCDATAGGDDGSAAGDDGSTEGSASDEAAATDASGE